MLTVSVPLPFTSGKNLDLDVMTAFLLTVILILCVLLYRAQKKDDNFDLRDLIVDKASGRVSLSRFGQLTALLVSTWGFVTLTLHDKLTEWYYGSYMFTWAAAEGYRKWQEYNKLKSNTPIAETVNTQAAAASSDEAENKSST